MKKSSAIIMIAVLLIGALMISCNSEVSGGISGDTLAKVTVGSGTAKSLTGTSTSNIPEVENLYWYYTATKVDNSGYTTGATTDKTPVKFDGNGAAAQGLANSTLGRWNNSQVETGFSQGYWNFTFYGYASSGATGDYVYTGTKNNVLVVDDVHLELSLTTGEGIPAGTVVFGNITFSEASFNGHNLTLKVYEDDSANASATATIESFNSSTKNTFELAPTSLTPAAGTHTYKFQVEATISSNTSGSFTQVIAENTITVVVQKGVKVTITGDVDELDEKYNVIIDNSTAPTTASASFASDAVSSEVKVTTNVTPANASSSSSNTITTVTFPAGSIDAGSSTTLRLDVNTRGLEAASANTDYSVTAGTNTAVAGISLTLTKETSGSSEGTVDNFSSAVTVETYIAKGLSNVYVFYTGSGSNPVASSDSNNATNGKADEYTSESAMGSNLGYAKDTGLLRFTTSHFSDFYVTSTDEAYNATLGKAYATLTGALAAVELDNNHTVMLLKNVTTAANINKSITLDGNGHSITVSGTDQNAVYTGTSGGGDVGSYGYLVYANAESVSVKNLTVTHSTKDNSKGSWYYRGVVVSSACKSINLDNVSVDMTTADNKTGAVVRIERSISGSSSVPRSSDDMVTVDINNCTFTNPDYYGFYAQSPVMGTISGTTFYGWNALYFKPGSTGSNLTFDNCTIHERSTSKAASLGMSTPGGNGFGAVVYEDSNISLTFNTCSFEMEVMGKEGTAAGQTLFMANDWNAINNNEHITINSGCTFTSTGTYEAFLVYSLTGGNAFDLKVAEGLVEYLDDTVEAPETKEFDSITRSTNTIKLGFAGSGSTYGFSYSWVNDTSGYKKLSMPSIITGYYATGKLSGVGKYACPIDANETTILNKFNESGIIVYCTEISDPITPTGYSWLSYSDATSDQRNTWYPSFVSTDSNKNKFSNYKMLISLGS